MADETKSPRIDPLQGRQGVHESTRDYINLIEKQNQQRVSQLLQQRRRARITGFSLLGLVVGRGIRNIDPEKMEAMRKWPVPLTYGRLGEVLSLFC